MRMREKICEEEKIHEGEKKSVRKSVRRREDPWGEEKIRGDERKSMGMRENPWG